MFRTAVMVYSKLNSRCICCLVLAKQSHLVADLSDNNLLGLDSVEPDIAHLAPDKKVISVPFDCTAITWAARAWPPT
jgi:hypothetical protein